MLTLTVFCVWESRPSLDCEQKQMYCGNKYIGLKCSGGLCVYVSMITFCSVPRGQSCAQIWIQSCCHRNVWQMETSEESRVVIKINIFDWIYMFASTTAVALQVAYILVSKGHYIQYKTYLLTYLLTPWCRVHLEKLTGLQLVKKFPAFHGTRKFITALTSVRRLSLSWASPNQSIYPHPTSWRSFLILSTHLRLGLPSGLFPSGCPTKTLYTPPLLPHARHVPSPSHSSRFYYPHNIGWGVQII